MNVAVKKSPRRAWLSQELMRLCAEDSTSGREDAMLPALHALLLELGAQVIEQPVAAGRTNVLALWGTPKVLFSTHLDTVPPYVAPRVEGDRVWGRGTCDAKGQILAQLEAIRSLREEGHDGFAWLGVVGEETDSLGAARARELIAHFHACRALINGEPTELKLGAGQRAILHLRLRCDGRAAHSSLPDLGRSAAWPMLDWLEDLRELPLRIDDHLGSEVWNLGRLDIGEAPNVIPANATADVLARLLPDSDFEVRVRDSMPEDAEVEVRLSEPADRYPEIPGFAMGPLPFGSDAPALRDLISDRTVVLAGPGSIRVAHTLDEHLDLDDLEAGIELNRRLAHHFLGSHGGEQ